MDNHNVKPEPNEVATASPEKSTNISSPISSSQNLLVKHPWLWFVGLLGIPLLVSIFGYYQLIYVGYTPQIEPEKPAQTATQKVNTPSSHLNNPTPLWLMLAIALTCASGCWVIYRLLKLPERV